MYLKSNFGMNTKWHKIAQKVDVKYSDGRLFLIKHIRP